MNDYTVPVLTVELEGIREQLKAKIDDFTKQINAAIDTQCSEENIARLVAEQTETTLRQAICEETERFYESGRGRIMILEAVEKQATEEATRPVEASDCED